MARFIAIDVSRYEIEAENIEDAQDKYRKVMGSTDDLSDEEFEKLVNEVVYLDGTSTIEEE